MLFSQKIWEVPGVTKNGGLAMIRSNLRLPTVSKVSPVRVSTFSTPFSQALNCVNSSARGLRSVAVTCRLRLAARMPRIPQPDPRSSTVPEGVSAVNICSSQVVGFGHSIRSSESPARMRAGESAANRRSSQGVNITLEMTDPPSRRTTPQAAIVSSTGAGTSATAASSCGTPRKKSRTRRLSTEGSEVRSIMYARSAAFLGNSRSHGDSRNVSWAKPASFR